MSLTIILSGPKVSASQARNALAAAQFDVQAEGHDYGLSPFATEDEATTEPQAFLTVLGDDVDKAHAAAQTLGWRLRMHHDTPEPAVPGAEQRLAATLSALEARIAQLESGVRLPPIGGAAVESPPWANQNTTIGAEQFRRGPGSLLARGGSVGSILGGIVVAGDCALTPPGSGMTVNVGAGESWVPGSSSATQGGYYCRVSSTTNLAISAASPSLPRIDTVCAVITDSAYSGVTNTFAVSVVTGTPTAGANLTNLNGAGSQPASSLILGYVLVPISATNIVSGDLASVAPVASLNQGMIQGVAKFQSGLAASRPSSASLPAGTLYQETDTGVLDWNTGSTWTNIPIGAKTVASAYRNSAYSLPTGSFQKVPIDTAAFDPGSNCDLTTNHRYNVPQTGYYFVSVGGSFDPVGTGGTNEGAMAVSVAKNGSFGGALPSQQLNNVLAGYSYTATASGIVSCTSGDYLELWAFMQLGSAGALGVGAGSNWLMVGRVA